MEERRFFFESLNTNIERPFNDDLPLQPNKDVSAEKSVKTDEEDGAKPKLSETRKVTRKHKVIDPVQNDDRRTSVTLNPKK